MSETGQVTCSVCGSANPAAAPVCQNCGRALPGLADRLFAADPGAAPAPPAASAPPPPEPPAPTPQALPAPPPAPPALTPPPTEAAEWQPPEDVLATWTGSATPSGDAGPPQRPRSRRPLLLGAIVAVLAVATIVFLLFGQDDDADPDPSAAPATTTTPADATTTTDAPATTSSTAATPPAQPTNLAVAADGPTSMSLTWIDAANNEERYLVARVRGDIVDQVADLPANSAGYVVDGLEPDTLYCFTVATTNGATGEPAFVPEACAVTTP